MGVVKRFGASEKYADGMSSTQSGKRLQTQAKLLAAIQQSGIVSVLSWQSRQYEMAPSNPLSYS